MKRVFYTVLDWGLGHATRSVPIIKELQRQNFHVILGGSGESLQLLKNEFPGLHFYDLPAYNPRYPAGNRMVTMMVKQLPKFYRIVKEEHQVTENIIRKEQIDVLISDNRYGCWSKTIPSIFITHQSNIQMPERFGWMAPLVRALIRKLLGKFSECWVPDFKNGVISGKLSDFSKLKDIEVKFIGPVSRFGKFSSSDFTYDVLAIFSGPEPQRSIFEEIVLKQLKNSDKSFFAVRGLPFYGPTYKEDNIINFANMQLLEQLIGSSKVVIARSGYSTVMDLIALRTKAVLVPTPGQTEQEYLAKVLHQRAWFYSTPQDKFDLTTALAGVHDCKLPSDLQLSENSNLKSAICNLRIRLSN
jgi:uncharacterized protein (TIGR00661 family)